MKKYGVIGVGSMGAMLVRKFTETGAIRPGDIVASNRTRGKAASLAEKIGFKEVESNVETARQSDIVFLCVKPLDVKRTLLELNKVLTPDKLLVSIAAGVTMENLLLLSRARVAKVIPSLTSECLRGVSLVAFAQNANESDRGEVFRLFRAISSPVEIDEGNFELFADLTSCAPAFIASIMREFVQAAAKKGDVPERFVEYLVRETLAGTAELLMRKEMSFQELVDRVATRGGITEEGVKIIRQQAPMVFDKVLEVTLAKHEYLKGLIREQES